MYSKLLLLVTLALTLLSGEAQQQQHVPFTIEEDANGNVVAVIAYGDEEHQIIKAPCGDNKFTGPGVIKCNVSPTGAYTLDIPFQFEWDEDGTIVGVTFDNEGEPQIKIPMRVDRNEDGEIVGVTFDDDVDGLQIPFRPKYDEDGNLVGVIYEENVSVSNKLSSADGSPTCAIVGLVLVGLLFLGGGAYVCKKRIEMQNADQAASSGEEKVTSTPSLEDDETEAGESVVDVEEAGQ